MRTGAARDNMTASESEMSGMRRLSDLSSKQADEALKCYSVHATKLADTSKGSCFLRSVFYTVKTCRYLSVKCFKELLFNIVNPLILVVGDFLARVANAEEQHAQHLNSILKNFRRKTQDLKREK